MVIRSVSGNFNRTRGLLKSSRKKSVQSILSKYGQKGVDALKKATPVDSGKTASSWSYEIEHATSGWNLYWKNSNINDGVPIALILQYGHGTGTGGYVQGRDYINPALQPIFDEIADSAWKEVRNS